MMEWLIIWILLSINAIFMSICVSYLFFRKHERRIHDKNEPSILYMIDSLHNKLAREIQARFQLSQEWNTVQRVLEKFQKEHQDAISMIQQQEQQQCQKWQDSYDTMNQQWKTTYDTYIPTWIQQYEQMKKTWYDEMAKEKTQWKQEQQQYEHEIQTFKDKYEQEITTIKQQDLTWKQTYQQDMDNMRNTYQTLVEKIPLLDTLQKEHKDLTEVFEDSVNKEGSIQQQLEAMQTNETQLETNQSILQEQERQLEQSLTHISTTTQDVMMQLNDLKQSFHDMKNIIQKLETHLTAELDDIRASFKDLQSIHDSHHDTWSKSHTEFIRVISEFNDMHNKVQHQMILMKQHEHEWRDKSHTMWNQFRTSIESRLEDEMKQSHAWIVQVQQLREDQKEVITKQNSSEKQLTWFKQKLDHIESIQSKQQDNFENKYKILENIQQNMRELSLSLTREEVTLRALQQAQQQSETTYGTSMNRLQKQIQNMGTTYKQQLDTFQHQVVRNYNTLVDSLDHIKERIGKEDTSSSSLPKWEGPPQIY